MPNVMAAQPNIGGAVCESSAVPFLVLCRKVWLTPTGQVRCSNAANNENARLGHKVKFARDKIPLGGKNPEKRIHSVAAQETAKHCKVWLASGEQRLCSNEAKTRNS